MDFTKIRVLVTDSGGKQPYAMIRGLKDLGCHVTVICGSKHDTCYVSNKPDKRILNTKYLKDDDDKFRWILSLVETGEYDVLMPIGEKSTDFITQHEAEFKKYVKLACAPRDVYIKCFNKQITFDQAIKSGVQCPYTRSSDQDIEDYLMHCRFPIIIKPRQGLGSIGFHKFNDIEEFRKYLSDPDFNVDDYVVQEFVDFEHRIGTLIFMDKNHRVCTAYATDVLRWFPLDAGSAVFLGTTDSPKLLHETATLLKDLDWQGFAAACFMIDRKTGEPKLLEINGRIPASVSLAYMLGYNISQQFLELIYDEEVTAYPENDKFGVYLRHFDTDLAWFLKSPDRFRTKPSWFSWKNTQEVLFEKDDKRPFFSNFFQRTFKYKQLMKKKQH
ncbi:MAG: ATP-grasp domain-containing protein [Bacteroidales bacterium]|nr:ATP-grasp domain-containing protein [Bacteroidales bacterium]